MQMELPREIYETYRAVAEKFASLHASPNDDDRREAHKRSVQTIRARHHGTGVLDGSRYVCKSQHSNGWAAASKDALAFVDPSFGPVEHGRRSSMFMFDMISGSSRKTFGFPVVAHNFSEQPANPDAFILVPDTHDWLQEQGAPATTPTAPNTHAYEGGENDTGICDTCGKPRADAVHEVKPKSDPVHASPDGASGDVQELLRQLVESSRRQEQRLDEIFRALALNR